MKKLNFGVVLLCAFGFTGCAMTKKNPAQNDQTARSNQQNQSVQTENKDAEAFNRASALASGWPDGSIQAAKDMLSKYGEPTETTSDQLIWRNVAPFKKVIVHKDVYNDRFPLLHQNALEHVVDYRAPASKVDDIWNYSGSIVLNRNKGEMSSYGENEAMNILSLNLAHDVMTGRYSAESARVLAGKETLSYMNGKATALTSVLKFGGQWQTSDEGKTVTDKIRWIGDPTQQRRPATQNTNTIQAQEDK